MGIPGITELLVIFGVVVLLFGAKQLPKLGGAIGESIKNFRKGIKDPVALSDKGGDNNGNGNDTDKPQD